MKRSLSFEVWIRPALGVTVIMGVVAIAIGRDTDLLTRFSLVNTAKAEGHSIRAFHPEKPAVLTASGAESQPALAPALGDEGTMPDLAGAVTWLNSDPLSSKSLHGKVVLVDFWTTPVSTACESCPT